VIGLNCERSITACLQSIKDSSTLNVSEIIYVDGGSQDKSVSYARSIDGIKIIELNLKNPTPGKGRNIGWQAAKGEWVHFFDSDTIVDKDWFLKVLKYIDDRTAAVFGLLKERYPNRNIFHFIANLEWPQPASEAKFCGGNVMIRRAVLEETTGYDEKLFGGADPELSVRMRAKGWNIKGVDAFMCYHDINMNSLSEYFKRSLRVGQAYAEAGVKMLRFGEKTWFLTTIKVLTRTTLVFSLITMAIFSKHSIYGLLAAAAIFTPMLKTRFVQKKFRISFKQAIIYTLHCAIVIWPQFCGILKYYLKAAGKRKALYTC
jgi:GT2 family glycosyltransferase